MLTDEQISDLGELLWQECQRESLAGRRLIPLGQSERGEMCPLGALVGSFYPMPILASQRAPGLSCGDAADFMSGFDGMSPDSRDPRLYQLGLLFREHALSGEAW